MKKIGILFGMEATFPPAFVDKVNSMKVPGVEAEFVKIGGIRMDEPQKNAVIIDRISQDIQFYRDYLKNAALHGTVVANNPFWWTADDKFFNYALAHKMGVAIPPTVILPHNKHPEGTTEQSMRNLIFPLNWQELFDYVGFPAFLKPYSGGGWKHVYKVHSPEEFFHHYNQTGDLCMTLQHGVEFAVEGGVPYAIDFLNPAPDAEITSVGQENFDWIVNAVAEMAVKMAVTGEDPAREMRWASFLAGKPAKPARKGEPAWVAERKRGKVAK